MRKNARNPTPTSVAVVVEFPIASIASGSTSKTATATTIPPVNAITVGRLCASRSAILPVVAVGTWRQHRYGNVRPRPAVVLGLAGAAGVLGGGFLAESLSDRTLERIFGTLMVVVAVQLAWQATRRPRQASSA